ncbi:MAG TPA: VOC family protein [Pyrinomonadaceae bacterium]|jgi:methylmalonyl-CoA/ethylmalonyl-CoA epimerase
MNRHGLSFHHFGLAVRQVDRALNFLSGLGYLAGAPVRDELQNVNLILCTSETMPDVEIIWPTETPGPVSNILTYSNELIYHACYESADLERSLAAIRKDHNSIVCVSEPKPAPLFAGRRVSFYYVRGFGMIEILETA